MLPSQGWDALESLPPIKKCCRGRGKRQWRAQRWDSPSWDAVPPLTSVGLWPWKTEILHPRYFQSVCWEVHERQIRKASLTPVNLYLLSSKPQWEIFRSLEIKVSWKQLRSGSRLFPRGRGSELLITACTLRAARSKKNCTHDDAESAGGEQKGAPSHPKSASHACNFILYLVFMKVNGHWGNQRWQREQ